MVKIVTPYNFTSKKLFLCSLRTWDNFFPVKLMWPLWSRIELISISRKILMMVQINSSLMNHGTWWNLTGDTTFFAKRKIVCLEIYCCTTRKLSLSQNLIQFYACSFRFKSHKCTSFISGFVELYLTQVKMAARAGKNSWNRAASKTANVKIIKKNTTNHRKNLEFLEIFSSYSLRFSWN